jgi:hypothetical protein
MNMEMNLVLPCEVTEGDKLEIAEHIDDGLAFTCFVSGDEGTVVLSDSNVAKLALALHQWQCRNLD